MATELAKTYAPAKIEAQVALDWDAARSFHAEPSDSGRPYCIVIPPPNVTAALHMGHALNNTLQDILIRWRRMCGDNTLWMPGTDHAGIATQTVVEKRVLANEGKRRTDLGRNAFVAKVQAWKDEYEAQITTQLKAMGCSCDWDRQRFTMDPICAAAVREAFFRMFKDGLIYRGKRLVNWDPVTQTALADDEVEMQEIDGHFWYLRYPLADGSGHVTVATTRPETMLGDTAVAVNPNDPRAAKLRGQRVRLPIVNRIVPIIEDNYVVLPDPESNDDKSRYSSGFLKVTPAHDPNDYEIGKRFDLPLINVMAPDGTISDQHGWSDIGDAKFLLGLDRYESREAIVEWFDTNDLLEDVKPYRHAVGHSYRSHVAIEPYLSDQWYLRVTDPRLAGAALAAMADSQYETPEDGHTRPAGQSKWRGHLSFTPARYAKTFQAWHENLRDWCISRQLWWGHRIPVWSADAALTTSEQKRQLDHWQDQERIAQSTGGAKSGRHHVCVHSEDDQQVIEGLESWGFQQDPDVLDTWFSSALWPFSTLGWPENTSELQTWNPGNVLCTARDIITLWVSRMVMTNLYLLDQLPFTNVFIHAMIQDGEGRRMSKSLGNGVDPLDIIHSHGADAMRFTLASMSTNTQDMRMPVVRNPQDGRNTSEKFDVGRNFANKLWNATRFALGNLASDESSNSPAQENACNHELANQWILSRLAKTAREASRGMNHFEFSQYTQVLYDFVWRDLCDWYIEAVKPTVRENQNQRRVLATCLDVSLRLLHPVIPFITEKLWAHLNTVAPKRGVPGTVIPPAKLVIRADWPQVDESLINEAAESEFHALQAQVVAIREIKASHQITARENVIVADEPAGTFSGHQEYIQVFANAAVQPTNELGSMVLVGTSKVGLDMLRVYRAGAGGDRKTERQRLIKRIDEVDHSIKTFQGRLQNTGYVEKAPPQLVQQTRDQLEQARREVDGLRQQFASLDASD